jgi:hypothetical protein
LEGWDQAAAGRCPVAGYAPTGSSFRVTTHLPRNDAPVARRLLSPVTDEDEIRGRELYLGYARDGRSALWLRLPNEEDVSKALRVLADYDYLHARYYGFNTGLCRLMSVIDSTNSGGGRSSAIRGSGWGHLGALRRVPEGEPAQEGGGRSRWARPREAARPLICVFGWKSPSPRKVRSSGRLGSAHQASIGT